MASSFYATYTSLFQPDNTTAWDDILLQYNLIEERCRNTTSNLLKHGYDESKTAVWADPETGASPYVWDRAVSWYFVSLLESIQVWPTTHEGHDKLVGYFATLAEGVLGAQDPATGGWWLLMDEELRGAEGNYIESSATAMFTYGFFKGVALVLLDEATYLAPAKKAYEYMVDAFVVELDDGTLDWEGTVSVGSLKGDASYEVSLFFCLSTELVCCHGHLLTKDTVLHHRRARDQRLQRCRAVHVVVVRVRGFVLLKSN